jgi:hypothetical protein
MEKRDEERLCRFNPDGLSVERAVTAGTCGLGGGGRDAE